MLFLSFIIPIVYLLCSTGLLVLISKRTFGKCIPLTMMICAFTYFLSQCVFKTFKVGFVINILFAILFIVYLVYAKIKKKDLSEFKSNYFTKGFYAFLVIYLVVFLYDLSYSFSRWDEFGQWGKMVKEMFRLDRFYTIPEANVIVHKDYVPIFQILELFFCHLIGSYQERMTLFAIHLFCMCLFIPSIYETKKSFNKFDSILKTLLIVSCIFLVIILFDCSEIIRTIYVDNAISILVVYLFCQIIFEKNLLSTFHIFTLSIGCSFLIYSKQISITLYLMVVFFYILNLVLRYGLKLKKWNKEKILNALKVIVLLILVPLLLWFGWSSYVNKMDIYKEFEISDIKLSELWGIKMGTAGEKYQQETINNFINQIQIENSTTSNIFKITYFQVLLISFVLIYFVWKYNKNLYDKKMIIALIVTLSIGAIGYAFTMLATYVFTFRSTMGPGLFSYTRYMSSYSLISPLLVLQLFIYSNTYREEKFKSGWVYLLLLILIIVQNPSTIYKAIPRPYKSGESIYEKHANTIEKYAEDGSKIFMVVQDLGKSYDGRYRDFINYYLDDKTINSTKLNWTDNSNNFQQYFDNEIKPDLKEYDYLYLAVISENFKNNYSFLFDNDEIEEYQIYKINKINDNLQFELIN